MSDEGLSAVTDRAGLLPFADGALDLVINRHESFRTDELARVLAPGGTFVTQQVDYHSDAALFELLGLDPPDEPQTWLPLATAQLTEAGLTVAHSEVGEEVRYFAHIGAVIYYLKSSAGRYRSTTWRHSCPVAGSVGEARHVAAASERPTVHRRG